MTAAVPEALPSMGDSSWRLEILCALQAAHRGGEWPFQIAQLAWAPFRLLGLSYLRVSLSCPFCLYKLGVGGA